MGSLSSRPSVPRAQALTQLAPSQPQPQSQPQATTFSVQATPPTPVVSDSEEQDTQDRAASDRRADNLLQQRRGRSSTISSSFRGVLEQSSNTPTRRTLLGE